MSKIFNKILRLPEFEKDLKKLKKKFRTLDEDLKNNIRFQLNLYHKLKEDNEGVFPISDLGIENPKIFKVKKFACRSLKTKGVKSGIRVIYAYYEETDTIELIEIYFKGEQKKEDRNRILRNYKK